MSSTRRIAMAGATVPVLVSSLVIGVPLFALSGKPTLPPVAQVAGIPDRVLRAYLAMDNWCPGLRWQLVAAIGAVESGHGTSGGAAADPDTGEVTPWIFGVPLDGSPGVQRLPIGGWLGWWGLMGPWQQAVGPMQFLSGTFTASGVDGDGDGQTNPHDIDDAVASAANYLCGGPDGAINDERAALRRYNNSSAYVDKVLAIADGFVSLPVGAGPILCPVAAPTTFTNTWLAPRSGAASTRASTCSPRPVRRWWRPCRATSSCAPIASVACRSTCGEMTATTTTAPIWLAMGPRPARSPPVRSSVTSAAQAMPQGAHPISTSRSTRAGGRAIRLRPSIRRSL